MKVYEWAEKLAVVQEDREWYIRNHAGVAIARYCTKCGDTGNGCETCKIAEFAFFCGIGAPSNVEEVGK
jgi:hypothetical protein